MKSFQARTFVGDQQEMESGQLLILDQLPKKLFFLYPLHKFGQARFHIRHCSRCQNLNCHHIECLCVEDGYNRKGGQGSTKCCLMDLRPFVMVGSLHSHPPVKFAYFDIFLCNAGERDEVRRAVL